MGKGIMDLLEESSGTFVAAMKEIEDDQEQFWESLSKDDQLKAFCAVARRIYDGEIRNGRSYRGVLYETFGFGPEAYSQAQMSGYLSIHNSIYDGEHMRELLIKFCKDNTIIDAEEKVDQFIKRECF